MVGLNIFKGKSVMEKVKKYGMFALGVLIVLLLVRLIKPMLPAAVQGYLP